MPETPGWRRRGGGKHLDVVADVDPVDDGDAVLGATHLDRARRPGASLVDHDDGGGAVGLGGHGGDGDAGAADGRHE